MKKIRILCRKENKFGSLSIKFASNSGCMCEQEACYSKCEVACQGQNQDIGYGNMWSKSSAVGGAINAVPAA